MKYKKQGTVVLSLIAIVAITQCTKLEQGQTADSLPAAQKKIHENDKNLIADGKQIFRFDAFGDEDFWSGTLHIDKAIAGTAHGGFGPGVSPLTALSVGLKVDAEALPPDIVAGIKA